VQKSTNNAATDTEAVNKAVVYIEKTANETPTTALPFVSIQKINL
jgi:hypothetical protein